MSTFPKSYDIDAAKERLEWVSKSRNLTAPDDTLGVMFTRSAAHARVQVVGADRGRSRVAVEECDGVSELVVEITGVVLNSDLPPIEDRIPTGRDKARYIRQSIKLTGLDSPHFANALQDVKAVRDVFVRSVTGNVQAADNLSEEDEGSIDISNRYFSSGRDVDQTQAIPFSTNVDPCGYLAALSSPAFVHTSDNEVAYVMYVQDPKAAKSRYIPCSPAAVKVGDIVTCKMAFCLVPLPRQSESKWKVLHVLRAIAVMDTSLTEEAHTTSMFENFHFNPKTTFVTTPTLKRGSTTFVGALTTPPKRSRRLSIDVVEDAVTNDD
ncbi:hypothetical protein BD626DRAFT_541730 [Schizophyllum amplum]|uniref:Uncharacterized protein n=1 Tax=Schizophyllum amplum TaxID=97359 RepID=A0A550BTP5_9AGAR|nr:hypothetical protein BD626DRAFT_541730 [Auriculariopsis ampla]